jgi:hypothetical protein
MLKSLTVSPSIKWTWSREIVSAPARPAQKHVRSVTRQTNLTEIPTILGPISVAPIRQRDKTGTQKWQTRIRDLSNPRKM